MRHQQRGFTLVELLVVITIIGLLAAMVMPAILDSQRNAKIMQCAERMKAIYTNIQSYRASHQSSPPAMGGQHASNWAMVLKDNEKGGGSLNNKVFFCPVMARAGEGFDMKSDDGDFMFTVTADGLSALSTAAPSDLPLIADCIQSNGKASNHGDPAENPINVQLKNGSTVKAHKGDKLFNKIMKQNMVGGANTGNINCPPPAKSNSSSEENQEETG
jgi:prepilin-type N-terminal cleavage/methylation domain-containing protein